MESNNANKTDNKKVNLPLSSQNDGDVMKPEPPNSHYMITIGFANMERRIMQRIDRLEANLDAKFNNLQQQSRTVPSSESPTRDCILNFPFKTIETLQAFDKIEKRLETDKEYRKGLVSKSRIIFCIQSNQFISHL